MNNLKAMQKNININLENCERLKCECGHDLFDTAIELYRVPRIIAGNDTTVLNRMIYVCKKCEKVMNLNQNTKPVTKK